MHSLRTRLGPSGPDAGNREWRPPTHEEIARLFELSVGAVKVRVHRALKELRDVYAKLSREPAA